MSYCRQIIALNLLKILSKDVAGGDLHLFVSMVQNKETNFYSSFGFMSGFCVLFSLSGLVSSPSVFTSLLL